MANHVHLVVVVPAELRGERLLQEFKSYGSRALNQRFGKPTSGTWWTKSGSTRLLPNDRAVRAAVEYVRNQQRPLVVWIAKNDPSTGIDGSRTTNTLRDDTNNPTTGVDGSTERADDKYRTDDAFRADDASRRVEHQHQPGRKKKGGG